MIEKNYFNVLAEDERSLTERYQFSLGEKERIKYIQKHAENYTDFKFAYVYHLILNKKFEDAEKIYRKIAEELTGEERAKALYFLLLYHAGQWPESTKINYDHAKELAEKIPVDSSYYRFALEVLRNLSLSQNNSDWWGFSAKLNTYKSAEQPSKKQVKDQSGYNTVLNVLYKVTGHDAEVYKAIKERLNNNPNWAWEAYKLLRYYFDFDKQLLTSEECLTAFNNLLKVKDLDSHLKTKLYYHQFYLNWERYKKTKNKKFLNNMLNNPLELPDIMKMKSEIQQIIEGTREQLQQYQPQSVDAAVTDSSIYLGATLGALCDIATLGTVSFFHKMLSEEKVLVDHPIKEWVNDKWIDGHYDCRYDYDSNNCYKDSYYTHDCRYDGDHGCEWIPAHWDGHYKITGYEKVDTSAIKTFEGKLIPRSDATILSLFPVHPYYGFTRLSGKIAELANNVINTVFNAVSEAVSIAKIKLAEATTLEPTIAKSLTTSIKTSYDKILEQKLVAPKSVEPQPAAQVSTENKARKRSYGSVTSLLFAKQADNRPSAPAMDVNFNYQPS